MVNDFVFKTSLNVEEFLNILQRRAYSTDITVTIKRDKLIFKKHKMTIGGIDFKVPFVSRMSSEDDNTVIKGNVSLPRSYYIVTLVAFLIPVCSFIASVKNGIQVYKLFAILDNNRFIVVSIKERVSWTCKKQFPPQIIMTFFMLLNSIATDYPGRN